MGREERAGRDIRRRILVSRRENRKPGTRGVTKVGQ